MGALPPIFPSSPRSYGHPTHPGCSQSTEASWNVMKAWSGGGLEEPWKSWFSWHFMTSGFRLVPEFLGGNQIVKLFIWMLEKGFHDIRTIFHRQVCFSWAECHEMSWNWISWHFMTSHQIWRPKNSGPTKFLQNLENTGDELSETYRIIVRE